MPTLRLAVCEDRRLLTPAADNYCKPLGSAPGALSCQEKPGGKGTASFCSSCVLNLYKIEHCLYSLVLVVYKMVIHVKDEEADMLVRRLARSRGIGITEAIKEAAREALAADAVQEDQLRDIPLRERLRPLLDRLDRLPRPEVATDKKFFDDLWGEGN